MTELAPIRSIRSAIIVVGLALAVAAPVGAATESDATRLERDGRRFAVDLYTRLATTPGNLFFSPWSIRAALGMVYAGARGHTERQMAMALHDALGQSRLHLEASRLERTLRSAEGAGVPGVELLTANAVWTASDARLRRSFIDTLTVRYLSPPRPMDFSDGGEARRIINAWVEEQTRARIHDLIPERAVDSSTRLVLCNAIYFQGAWQDSFRSSATKDGRFYLLGRDDIRVPFMHASRVGRYAETPDLQVLELPYRSDSLALLIILPRDLNGLPLLERGLDPDSLAGWESRMERVYANVALPRFRIEGKFELGEPLAAMGMRDAFGPRADFSGIAPEQPLFISQVYHRAFLTVDEHGTEAAAATAVLHYRGGSGLPQRDVTVAADHPFLFLIRHRSSGAILFMGRLVDPR